MHPITTPPPRPLKTLPFHLSMQGMLWLASNNGLGHSNPSLESLSKQLPNFAQIAGNPLGEAVRAELAQQNIRLMEGIRRFQTHPYQRPDSPSHTIWQEGSTRLLDYAPDLTQPDATVLFIPSLINRHYILDLLPGHSFTNFLKEQNIRPLVIDWQTPSKAEQDFNCERYILHRLRPALEAAPDDAPLFLAGYCMGGLLALALAQLEPERLAGLALLACPWNFHSNDFSRAKLDADRLTKLDALLTHSPTVAGEVLQTLFYATNPWVFTRKFARFAEMDMDSHDAKRFIAMESWVNDVTPLATGVARECLIDWTQHNKPAQGKWQVGGETILPEAIKLPSFIACPTRDKVVPPRCSGALVPHLPNVTYHQPDSGHIGMVAGRRAGEQLWHPFHAWIHAQIKARNT